MKPIHFIYGALLLITVAVSSVVQPLAHLPAFAQQGNCRTFSETGKTVCGRFLQYWQQNGGLAQQGYPISPEFVETSTLNNQPYTVQYFERAVFEMHPENKPPYDVLLSQLGTFQARARYGNPPAWPGAPSPTPVPPPPPGVGATTTVIDGVVLTFTNVSSHNYAGCGPVLEWEFNVQNGREQPVSLVLDQASVSMVDNAGKTYAGACGPSGAFSSPSTVPAKGSAPASVRVGIEQLSPGATYLDLRFTLSGKPLVFRFPLR